MKKSTFCRKAITLAAAGMLTLSTLVIPATAMDDDDDFYGNGQVFGINLTGDFAFNKVAINGFSHTQVGGSGSAQSTSPFFYLDDGIAKTEIPFFTFGESVVYPGIFYNSGETQFHHLVANAAAGDSVAASTVTMYAAAAAAAIAVGVVAADASAGGSGGNNCAAIVEDYCGTTMFSASTGFTRPGCGPGFTQRAYTGSPSPEEAAPANPPHYNECSYEYQHWGVSS